MLNTVHNMCRIAEAHGVRVLRTTSDSVTLEDVTYDAHTGLRCVDEATFTRVADVYAWLGY